MAMQPSLVPYNMPEGQCIKQLIRADDMSIGHIIFILNRREDNFRKKTTTRALRAGGVCVCLRST